MTIVEIIDQHQGFKIITDKITTTKKVKLLWILSILTFFMSTALDNLTTTIVMVALLRKLIADKETRWFFASMVVLAANAGGAWSPIGDAKRRLTVVGILKKVDVPTVLFFLGILSAVASMQSAGQ
jgi:Na+/H+ antiporter NhaD/arsenite permease-like protein